MMKFKKLEFICAVTGQDTRSLTSIQAEEDRESAVIWKVVIALIVLFLCGAFVYLIR